MTIDDYPYKIEITEKSILRVIMVISGALYLSGVLTMVAMVTLPTILNMNGYNVSQMPEQIIYYLSWSIFFGGTPLLLNFFIRRDEITSEVQIEKKGFNIGIFIMLIAISGSSWIIASNYFENISIHNPSNDKRCDIDDSESNVWYEITGKDGTILHEYCQNHVWLFSLLHPSVYINEKGLLSDEDRLAIMFRYIGYGYWIFLISSALLTAMKEPLFVRMKKWY